MKSKALLATTALILALSAVSCGKEDGESSVSISYGETSKTSVAEDTAEESEESAETTTGKTTATTATTAVSGTETTTTAVTEETTEETATTETSAGDADSSTTTSAPAETTAPPATEAPAETSAENNTPAPEENNGGDNSQPDETQATQAPEPVTEEPTENNAFEFKFTVDNLLNDASGLISMLGTPDYSGEAQGCTTNGNDVKIYQYDGLEVQCYIDGATEYIFSIEITSDKYETDKGIKTGASRAEVESAYGTGETSGNMTVYYTGNNEMDIEYNGDTVTSIFFYAPV